MLPIKVFAAISIIVGTYLGRMIFVYDGNAYPMNDRFNVGFEKYGEYEPVKEIIFYMPPTGEIAIVIGSLGVILIAYGIIRCFTICLRTKRTLVLLSHKRNT